MSLFPANLEQLRKEMKQCRDCPLHQGTTQAVPGIGSTTPKIVFIGEAPGEVEDREGIPFRGPAGQELQDILTEMEFTMDEIYITNITKHRPPGNRAPKPEEVAVCGPKFLEKELAILKPQAIVALGRSAAEALMRLQGLKPPRGTIRGTTYMYRGIPVHCTWHPSYVIRNGNSHDPNSEAHRLRGEMITDISAAWNKIIEREETLPY